MTVTTGGQQQFPGPVRVYGDIHSNDRGIDKIAITKTTADITLYVAATGNDSNDGLTVGTALLTIQSAVDKIPDNVLHKVTINIGAGNFAGFAVRNKLLGGYLNGTTDYQFTIQGADFVNYTPVGGGTGNGTATGGTTSTLIDIGQAWATNALRGKLVFVNSEWLIIRKNDATSLETIGISTSTMSGKAYVIQDWATVITGKVLYGNVNHGIYIHNIIGVELANYAALKLYRLQAVPSAGGTINGITCTNAAVYLSYLSVASVNQYGIQLAGTPTRSRTDNLVASSCLTVGLYLSYFSNLYSTTPHRLFAYGCGTYGIAFQDSYGKTILYYIYADNNTGTGVFVTWIHQLLLRSFYASGNTGIALNIYGTQNTEISSGVIDSNGYGLVVNIGDAVASVRPFGIAGVYITSQIISNNINGAIWLGTGTNAYMATVTGVGNGGFGIYARYGAKAFITSGTTVTGTSGDIKIGDVVNSYATDFATDNSYVWDVSEGTLIKRKDTLAF